jgi:hypothetical protein
MGFTLLMGFLCGPANFQKSTQNITGNIDTPGKHHQLYRSTFTDLEMLYDMVSGLYKAFHTRFCVPRRFRY